MRPSYAITAACLGVLVMVGVTPAQVHDLDWYTVDGGGVMFSTGGSLELSGSVGQPDAGPPGGASSASYALTGGFWFGVGPGDCDQDGDVDLGDFADFQACLGGPGGGLGIGCECFDFDFNGDVDTRDFAEFQVLLPG